MIGALAAPQRCVVHRRQVVEDQRGRVDQLDGGGRGDGLRDAAAAQLGAQQHEHRADLLRGGERGVGHRPLDRAAIARHVAAELRVDPALVLREESGQSRHFGATPNVRRYW